MPEIKLGWALSRRKHWSQPPRCCPWGLVVGLDDPGGLLQPKWFCTVLSILGRTEVRKMGCCSSLQPSQVSLYFVSLLLHSEWSLVVLSCACESQRTHSFDIQPSWQCWFLGTATLCLNPGQNLCGVPGACWAQRDHDHGSKGQNKVVWVCFIYINTQQEAFVLLEPSLMVSLPARCIYWKTPQLCTWSFPAGSMESKQCVMSSVCTLWCSSEQKGSHQKTLYCPEGRVATLDRQDYMSWWDVQQCAEVAVPLSGIGFYFPEGVMTAEQWTRDVVLPLKYTGGPTEPVLTSLPVAVPSLSCPVHPTCSMGFLIWMCLLPRSVLKIS